MLRRPAIREWLEIQSFEFADRIPATTRASEKMPVATRVWGPVEKVQFDHKNNPLQTYRSVLLADSDGSWLLLMDTVDAGTAEHSTAVILPKQALPAREWLCDNGFVEECPTALFEF